jgi:phage head maturation protease
MPCTEVSRPCGDVRDVRSRAASDGHSSQVTVILGPLELGEITSLIGEPGTELLVLTVAIAVSYRTGLELIPGWKPVGSGDVTVFSYEGPSWCAWRSIEQDICDAAGITAPVINFGALNSPYFQPELIPEEPIARAFFVEAAERDEKAAETSARATGQTHLPPLKIVYGLGVDGSPRIYEDFRGRTALFVGAWSFFLFPPQTDAAWAGTYGPIARVPELRHTTDGLSEFLERTVARVEPLPSIDHLARPAPDIPRGDASAFFEWQGIEAIRAIWTDGRSEESQRLKGLARDHGITPGVLYRAAVAFARDAGIGDLPASHTPGIGFGYAATWDWFEVHDTLEGWFMQRFARGAFTRTLDDDRELMQVRFKHGWDRRFADTPLGPISVLLEDDHGVNYEVPLLDNPHNRELTPWLATGLYGSSSHFKVLADAFLKSPGASSHNPHGIPEHTILEVRMQEFGPVYPPWNPGTSAGIRD